MKKMLLIFTLFASAKAMAQQPLPYHRPAPAFRINAFGSYVFSDSYDSYYSNTSYYDGKVNGGFQWGLGVEWMARPNQGVELTYLREDTKAPTKYTDGTILNPLRNTDFNTISFYKTVQ